MRYSGPGLVLTTLVLSSLAVAQSAGRVTYEQHVRPILDSRCTRCHNAGRDSGGLMLDGYAKLMEGGASGEVIKPGDAEGSRLFRLVSHQERPHMPPGGGKLDPKALETIRRWIETGALENAGSKAPAPKTGANALRIAPTAGRRPDGPPPMPPRLSLEPITESRRPNAVTALAASPWAPLLAAAGHRQILLFRTDRLDLVGILPFPEGTPHVLRFSPGGGLLLAGGGHPGARGRVVLWHVATGRRAASIGEEFDCVLAADVSADQTRVALGGPGKVVRVYDTAQGRLLYAIEKHTDWVTALAFSPDGVLLATGDRAGNLFVWEADTGQEYLSLPPHRGRVTALAWRIDSNVLASAGEDGAVRLFKAEDGTQLKRFNAHGGGTLDVKFGRDGRLLTCGRDRQVKVWKPDGKLIKSYRGPRDLPLEAVFDHDLKRIFAGDWTGTIHVWDASSGKVLGRMPVNPPSIRARITRAEVDLTVARKQSTDLKRKEELIRARLSGAEHDVAWMKGLLRAAEGRAAPVNREVGRLRADYLREQAALTEARGRNEPDETHVKRVLASLRALGRTGERATRANVEVRRAKARVRLAETKRSTARKQLAAATRAVRKITRRIPGLEAALQRWRTEEAFAKRLKILAKVEGEWDAAGVRARDLRGRMRTARKRSETLEKEIETLETALSDKKDAWQDVQLAIAELEDEEQKAAKQLATARTRVESCRAEVQSLRARLTPEKPGERAAGKAAENKAGEKRGKPPASKK